LLLIIVENYCCELLLLIIVVNYPIEQFTARYHIRPVLEADFEIFSKREPNLLKEQWRSFICGRVLLLKRNVELSFSVWVA